MLKFIVIYHERRIKGVINGNTHEILGLVKSLIRLRVRSTKGNKGQNHALYFDYENENKKKQDQITKEDWIFLQSMVVIFRTL